MGGIMMTPPIYYWLGLNPLFPPFWCWLLDFSKSSSPHLHASCCNVIGLLASRVNKRVNTGTTYQVRWLVNVFGPRLENLVLGPRCTVRVSTGGATPLLHGRTQCFSLQWVPGGNYMRQWARLQARYKNLCFVFTADKLLLGTFKGDLKSYLCSPLTFINLKHLWGRRMAVTSRAVRNEIIGCDLHSFTANRRCDCFPRCSSVRLDSIHGPRRKWTVADCTPLFAKGLCAVVLRGVNPLILRQTSGLAVGMTRSGFTSKVLIAFVSSNLNFCRSSAILKFFFFMGIMFHTRASLAPATLHAVDHKWSEAAGGEAQEQSSDNFFVQINQARNRSEGECGHGQKMGRKVGHGRYGWLRETPI